MLIRGSLRVCALTLVVAVIGALLLHRPAPPGILLISIDSRRHDHLGVSGYVRNTTPNLDALARRGVLFRQAISASSWTLPAHVTLLTALPPESHGVVRPADALAPAAVSLAEVLHDAGSAMCAPASTTSTPAMRGDRHGWVGGLGAGGPWWRVASELCRWRSSLRPAILTPGGGPEGCERVVCQRQIRQGRAMARIPYPDLATLHPRARAALEALQPRLNIFRILTHAERNFRPLIELGGTILGRQELPGRERELAILLVAALSQARYEWIQHVPIARAVGVRDDEIGALEALRFDDPVFGVSERAILTFTREVVERTRPSDEALAALRAHYPDRQVVELTIAIGFYMMMARVMEVTGIEIDPAAGEDLLRGLERGARVD